MKPANKTRAADVARTAFRNRLDQALLAVGFLTVSFDADSVEICLKGTRG